MRFIPVLILALLWSSASPCARAPSFEARLLFWGSDKPEIEYLVETGRYNPGHAKAKNLFRESAASDKLYIVFDGLHTSLYYDGMSLNSFGNAGIHLRSQIYKQHSLFGDYAVLIEGLSSETKRQLRLLIREKPRWQDMTCSHMTSRYLTAAGVELKLGQVWTTSALAEKLFELKAAGANLKIISLDGYDPGLHYARYRAREIWKGAAASLLPIAVGAFACSQLFL